MLSSCGTMAVVVVALMVLQASSGQETSARPCRMYKCAPICAPGKGPDGCPTCDCPKSCQNVTCNPGSVCQMETRQCFTTPCDPEVKCVAVQETTAAPCRMYKCAPNCVPGTGPDGCPTCECPPSCETVRCSSGNECQLVDVTCFRAPCFPQPQCVATKKEKTAPCRKLNCSPKCVRGKGPDGCPTCDCTPTPSCETVRCSAGNECQMVTRYCLRAPCPSGPQCVPVKSSCTETCASNCFTVRRRGNKCPKCICPNPCKRMRCRAGQECKLSEEASPKAICAPKS